MFGFLNIFRIKKWELLLLKNTLEQLPDNFRYLKDQLSDGILSGKVSRPKKSTGRVVFGCNQTVRSQYIRTNEKDYKITGIRVYDKRSKSQLLYTLFVRSGLLYGYTIVGADQYNLDARRVNTSWSFLLNMEDLPDDADESNKPPPLELTKAAPKKRADHKQFYGYLKDWVDNL